MKQMKYKVEVFIAPKENIYSRHFKTNDMQVRSDVFDNVIGDIKQNNANHIQSNKNNSFSMEEVNMPNLEKYIETGKSVTQNTVDLSNFKKDAGIRFCSSFDVPEVKCEELFNENKVCYFTNVLHRIHNYSPNKERNRDNGDKQVELCYGGYNNGRSATVSSPQEVSNKIFNENGIQKLKDIKQRELVLRNREIVLQNREKALFQKEKELELLKDTLIEKLKQLDLQFKENKQLCLLELNTLRALEDTLESSVYMDSKQINAKSDTNNDSEIELNNLDVNKMNLCTKDSQTQNLSHEQNEQLHRCTHNIGIVHKALYEGKVSSGSPTCAPSDDIVAEGKLKLLTNTRSNKISKSSSKFAYERAKKLSKDYYDDLDTTLSADIGDSSFVQTSQKFNPILYKKPYAFRRATSERHMKHMNHRNSAHVETEELSCHNAKHQVPLGIEQDKVFKKVTQNIFASQDKSTKFQHYGLIDRNMDVINKICTVKSEKRYSYLNLETQNKSCSCLNLNKDLNNRPVSWNEKRDEWFKKKRSANNIIQKKIHIDNKENLEYNPKTKNKFEKALKKRDIKTKILTIFR